MVNWKWGKRPSYYYTHSPHLNSYSVVSLQFKEGRKANIEKAFSKWCSRPLKEADKLLGGEREREFLQVMEMMGFKKKKNALWQRQDFESFFIHKYCLSSNHLTGVFIPLELLNDLQTKKRYLRPEKSGIML